MTVVFRATNVVAFLIVAAAGVVGSGASSAMRDGTNANTITLPADVIETADAEAMPEAFIGGAPATPTPDVPAPADPAPAGSLAMLVAQKVSSTPASNEAACLAVAVFFEARSEALGGQLAVARTIINRVRSGRFASTICGVVKQPGQFSFVRAGNFPPIERSSRDWREAVAIADIASRELWQSSVGNALYFHARHVSPQWKLTRIASIGNHVFYK